LYNNIKKKTRKLWQSTWNLESTDLFNQAILVADLERHLNITVIADNKAKDLFKVTKANPILEYRTGDNVIIYLNEGILIN
jgi:hypothetical protein